jgi:hypothetical protein
MEEPFLEVDAKHFFMAPFPTIPLEGYKPVVNSDGEVFPNCCPYHKGMLKDAETWFEKFPNCCDQHRKMAKEPNFNKSNYPGVPLKIINQVSYTEFHIQQRMEADDWYEDITDYIQYNIKSFGHPSVGSGLYFGIISRHIKNKNVAIPKIKRAMLIEYLNAQTKVADRTTSKTSLNILYSTYQKWLKAFPFELEFFKAKKELFEKTFPIIDGEMHQNRYLDLSSGKLLTPIRLIEALLDTTKKLLANVDTNKLVKDGVIVDTKKQLFDFINESHRLKQTNLLGEYSSTETRYVTILKNWLANEKAYFQEVTALFTDKSATIIQPTKRSILEKDLAKYNFTNLPFVAALSTSALNSLYDLLAAGQVPYQVALFEDLGFITYIKKEFALSDVKLFKKLAEILDSNERVIKGNIYVLKPYSKENKNRYTAHLHITNVQADLKKLK